MDPFSQAALGAVVAQASAQHKLGFRVVVAGAFAGAHRAAAADVLLAGAAVARAAVLSRRRHARRGAADGGFWCCAPKACSA